MSLILDSIKNKFIDSEVDENVTTDCSRTSSIRSSLKEEREEALKRLYKGVEVCNRRYRFKKYKRCFVGSEAVDFMVQSGWATSREHAVQIGRKLQTNYSLFEHVVEPEMHVFQDDYLFYKFLADIDSSSNEDEARSNNSSKGTDTEGDSMNADSICYQSKGLQAKLGLVSVGEILRNGVTQKYNYAIDKEGFYANEAVDYLVSVGLSTSRQDAVFIGLALEQSTGVIQNAKTSDSFSDSKLFYCFLEDRSKSWRDELAQAQEFFQINIKQTDHTFRLKKYKNTFTGSEAVDLLLTAGITSSRQDAVLLGRALSLEYNLFGHVVDEHIFEDSDLFYKFSRNHTSFSQQNK